MFEKRYAVVVFQTFWFNGKKQSGDYPILESLPLSVALHEASIWRHKNAAANSQFVHDGVTRYGAAGVYVIQQGLEAQ